MTIVAKSVHRQLQSISILRTLHTTNKFCETNVCRSIRQINLLRPNANNSLNVAMVEELYNHIHAWEENDFISTIMISSNLETFCGGIDMHSIEQTPKQAIYFYQRFNSLVYLISTLSKHGISFFPGPIYGSSFGIANTQHRFVSESAKFCIPDLRLGLCLAGGLSHILPRLDYPLPMELARYLAFTGSSLNFVEMLGTGLATAYYDPASPLELETFVTTLGTLPSSEPEIITNALNLSGTINLSKKGVLKLKKTPIAGMISSMSCFSGNTVEEIIHKLLENGTPWANESLEKIMQVNPINLKIAFEQLNLGKNASLVDCLLKEYLITAQMMDGKFINITQIGKVWTPSERQKQFPNWWKSVSEYLEACQNVDTTAISDFMANLTQYKRRYPLNLDPSREKAKYTPTRAKDKRFNFEHLHRVARHSEHFADVEGFGLRSPGSHQIVSNHSIGDNNFGIISRSMARLSFKGKFVSHPAPEKN